jgi:hypothetical protein
MDAIKANICTPESIFALSIAAKVYHSWRRKIFIANSKFRTAKKPTDSAWLGSSEYALLVAICDTMIPQLSEDEVTFDNVLIALESISPGITKAVAKAISNETVVQNRRHLMRGAVESGVHELLAVKFQAFLSKDDKVQLGVLLGVMSTALGNLLVTGYPAPFQVNLHTSSTLMLFLQ